MKHGMHYLQYQSKIIFLKIVTMIRLLTLIFTLISNTYALDLTCLKYKSLNVEQVQQLELGYQAQEKTYAKLNQQELLRPLPIIITNPHHRSIQYWLFAQLKNKNLKGLPVLHLDSHTDMGFSPSHYTYQNKKLPIKEILNNLSEDSIKEFDNTLTDISQVLIPAMATKLVNEFYMCMPDWYSRTNNFNSAIAFNLYEFNKAQFITAKTNRYFPVTKIKNTFTNSPFVHSKKYDSSLKGKMTFINCFKGELPKINSDYILSLDLDILSTNGVSDDHSRPISKYRDSTTKKISELEFKEFKVRLKKIVVLINRLKEKGFLPKIITIADSTGAKGGKYTPTALALLANKYLKREFRKL
jgi:hypothetical protein